MKGGGKEIRKAGEKRERANNRKESGGGGGRNNSKRTDDANEVGRQNFSLRILSV